MKKLAIILSFSCLSSVIVSQQQTLLTNIVLHKYLYNPAYAGSVQGIEFNASYRNQWTGFDGAPKNIVASGYGTLKKKPMMAVGGFVMSDKVGLIQRSSFQASYSYHLKLNKATHLGFGVSVGGVQYNVKAYNAKPYDKEDAFLRNDILNANALDANSGLYLYSKKYFLGFSSTQMFNSKIHWENTNGKLTPHSYFNAGYNIVLDKKKKEWVLQPSVLARFSKPSPSQYEITLRGIYKELAWLGMTYRTYKDEKWKGASFSMMLGTTIGKQFTVGYSYDYALSIMQNYSSGSHEIILSYLLASKKKKSASEKVSDADESEFNNIDNSMKTNLKNHKKKGDHK
jgi:type IX secretion system PorP/SprF family membrane protein